MPQPLVVALGVAATCTPAGNVFVTPTPVDGVFASESDIRAYLLGRFGSLWVARGIYQCLSYIPILRYGGQFAIPAGHGQFLPLINRLGLG